MQSITAKVAQLVERDLAKVEVAGSSPVFRSTPHNARMVKLVDTLDLKSSEQQCSCGFKSRSEYKENPLFLRGFLVFGSILTMKEFTIFIQNEPVNEPVKIKIAVGICGVLGLGVFCKCILKKKCG